MNKSKLILTVTLGAFLVAAVIYMAFGRPDRTPAKRTAQAGIKAPREKLVVYYFHRTMRCPGCRNLEKLTRETLSTSYAKELETGVVELVALNVEDHANEQYVTRYSVYGSTLVVSVQKDGKEQSFKILDGAFELKFERRAFAVYFKAELDALLQKLRGSLKS